MNHHTASLPSLRGVAAALNHAVAVLTGAKDADLDRQWLREDLGHPGHAEREDTVGGDRERPEPTPVAPARLSVPRTSAPALGVAAADETRNVRTAN